MEKGEDHGIFSLTPQWFQHVGGVDGHQGTSCDFILQKVLVTQWAMVCRTAGSRNKGQGAKAEEMQKLQQNLFFLSLYPGAY